MNELIKKTETTPVIQVKMSMKKINGQMYLAVVGGCDVGTAIKISMDDFLQLSILFDYTKPITA